MSYCYEKGIRHSAFLEWPAEDRAKVLAYALEQGTRCSMCGTAPWEWEEHKFAYTPVDELCRGCYLKAMHSETQQKPLPGTNVKLLPTTPELKAQMQISQRKREAMLEKE